jgi:6-phosphogluconate dehydrogenase (decarboxylating)
MRLAGYEDYEAKINEYENDPEVEYMDVEDQMIGLSGGLNGPKKAYAAAAGGDNAMAQEPTEVEESLAESFYKEYSKMIDDLKNN